MASTIILSDNGASSGSAGLKQTAGNDGVLLLQTTTSGGTATTAVTIDTAQNVTMAGRTTNPTTISVGGVTPSTSGSGISFPATQSASSDANTLDDYEEGTWTTTTGAATNLSGLTLQQARYTKVGRLVTIDGYFESTITSANTLTYFSFTIPFPLISTTAGGAGPAVTNNEFAPGIVYRASGSTAAVYMLFKASIGFGSGSNLLFFTYTYQTT